MLFSVLVALYNNARFLEACIKSVYAQTYQNWELIIVDDGSTDNVNDVLLPYRHDARIRVYRNTENRGCAFTKHRLATLVQGELAAFLDPDDALTTDALEAMVNLHQLYPKASIINSTHYVCDENLAVLRISEKPKALPHNVPYLLLSDGSIHAFASFKQSCYNSSPGVSPKRENDKAVDQDFYYVLEEMGEVIFVNKPLYYYRIHKGSISNEGQEAAAMISHNNIIATACRRRIKALRQSNASDREKWIKIYRARFHKVRIINGIRAGNPWLLFPSLLVYPFAGGMENIMSYLKKLPREGIGLFRRSFVETYKH
jgi:glycosyltransferase involved in cell wall biosynthesis